MKKISKPTLFALVLLTIILCAPPWGDVARTQALSAISVEVTQPALDSTTDFQIEIARAEQQTTPTDEKVYPPETAAILHRLSERFPINQEVIANVLRMSCESLIDTGRTESPSRNDDEPPPAAKPNHNTPENLAEFERLAILGERLDPENAYFPMMHLISLYATHKDDEALIVLHRASTLPRYEDYAAIVADGGRQISGVQDRPGVALSRITQFAAIRLAHCAQIRQSMRVAVSRAIDLEKAGKTKEGLRIRQAVARCGQRMRQGARGVIQALVGVAFQAMAATRPGGARYEKQPEGLASDAALRKRMQPYVDYLRRIRETAEADWISDQIERCVVTKSNISRSLEEWDTPRAGILGQIKRGAGFVIAANLFWFLIAVIFAKYACSSVFVRENRPLPMWLHRGLQIGFVWPYWFVVAEAVSGGESMRGAMAIVMCIYALVYFKRTPLRDWPKLLAITISCWVLLAGAAYMAVRQTLPVTLGMHYAPSTVEQQILLSLTAFVAPALFVTVVGILAVFWKSPEGYGVLRGLRGLGPWCLCILLSMWLISLIGLARWEATDMPILEQTVTNEVRLFGVPQTPEPPPPPT